MISPHLQINEKSPPVHPRPIYIPILIWWGLRYFRSLSVINADTRKIHRPLVSSEGRLRYHRVPSQNCMPKVESGKKLQWCGGGEGVNSYECKVRGQKDSSDGGFRAKFTIFNRTIPNTV